MHWIAPSEKNADNVVLEKRLCNAAMRDSASNPAKPNAVDGKQPTTTFFKK
jgi:hypothetical protein